MTNAQALADATGVLERFGHRLRVDSRLGGSWSGWWIGSRGYWRQDVRGELRWLVLQALGERRRTTGQVRSINDAVVAECIEEMKSRVGLLTYDEWSYPLRREELRTA